MCDGPMAPWHWWRTLSEIEQASWATVWVGALAAAATFAAVIAALLPHFADAKRRRFDRLISSTSQAIALRPHFTRIIDGLEEWHSNFKGQTLMFRHGSGDIGWHIKGYLAFRSILTDPQAFGDPLARELLAFMALVDELEALLQDHEPKAGETEVLLVDESQPLNAAKFALGVALARAMEQKVARVIA